MGGSLGQPSTAVTVPRSRSSLYVIERRVERKKPMHCVMKRRSPFPSTAGNGRHRLVPSGEAQSQPCPSATTKAPRYASGPHTLVHGLAHAVFAKPEQLQGYRVAEKVQVMVLEEVAVQFHHLLDRCADVVGERPFPSQG